MKRLLVFLVIYGVLLAFFQCEVRAAEPSPHWMNAWTAVVRAEKTKLQRDIQLAKASVQRLPEAQQEYWLERIDQITIKTPTLIRP